MLGSTRRLSTGLSDRVCRKTWIERIGKRGKQLGAAFVIGWSRRTLVANGRGVW